MEQRSEGSSPEPGDEVQAPAALVRPQMRGRAIPMVPRTLGVALIVGALAFLAGVQFGPMRGTGAAVTVTTPRPALSLAPTQAASPTDLPEERSPFASTFDPSALLLKAGLACSGGGSGGSGGGHAFVMYFSRCSVPATRQPALILQVEQEISTAIRETAIERDGGLGRIDPEGPNFQTWNYRSDGFDGSVTFVATQVGSDLQFVIALEEQPPA